MIQDYRLATHPITAQSEISNSRRRDIVSWPSSLDILQCVTESIATLILIIKSNPIGITGVSVSIILEAAYCGYA